jgi:hypothetical protein
LIQTPTINLPNDYFGTFNLGAEIRWNSTETKIWDTEIRVTETTNFSGTTEFGYISGTQQALTGQPTFSDPGALVITWTVTITPSRTEAITTWTTTGTGGTFSVNNTTKVITITGTATQINSRIQGLQLTSVANREYYFTLTYYASNTTNSETDTITQSIVALNQTYLSIAGIDTFQTGTQKLLTNAPNLTDAGYTGRDDYTLSINTDDGLDLSDLRVSGTRFRWDFGSVNTFGYLNPSYITSADQSWSAVGNPFFNSNRGQVKVIASNGTETILPTPAFPIYQPNSFFTVLGLNANGSRLVCQSLGQGGSFPVSPYLHVYTRSGTTWSLVNNFQIQLGGIASISEDTLHVVISQPTQTVSAFSNAGRVLYYTWVTNNWTLQQTITAPSPKTDEQFATTLKISSNGQYLIVGTQQLPVSGTPKLIDYYIYFRSTTTFSHQRTLSDSQPAGTYGTQFRNLDISGNGDRIVEAKLTTTNLNLTGPHTRTIGVWTRSGTTWTFGWNEGIGVRYDFASPITPSISKDGKLISLLIEVENQTDNGNIDFSQIRFWRSFSTSAFFNAQSTINFQEYFNNPIFFHRLEPNKDLYFFVQTATQRYHFFYNLNQEFTGQPLVWNNSTKILTVFGNKSEINLMLDTVRVTVSATKSELPLIYSVTNPQSALAIRLQKLIRIT